MRYVGSQVPVRALRTPRGIAGLNAVVDSAYVEVGPFPTIFVFPEAITRADAIFKLWFTALNNLRIWKAADAKQSTTTTQANVIKFQKAWDAINLSGVIAGTAASVVNAPAQQAIADRAVAWVFKNFESAITADAGTPDLIKASLSTLRDQRYSKADVVNFIRATIDGKDVPATKSAKLVAASLYIYELLAREDIAKAEAAAGSALCPTPTAPDWYSSKEYTANYYTGYNAGKDAGFASGQAACPAPTTCPTPAPCPVPTYGGYSSLDEYGAAQYAAGGAQYAGYLNPSDQEAIKRAAQAIGMVEATAPVICDLNAGYDKGYSEGKASVICNMDAGFDRGYQKGYGEGAASVDITTDNAAARDAGYREGKANCAVCPPVTECQKPGPAGKAGDVVDSNPIPALLGLGALLWILTRKKNN